MRIGILTGGGDCPGLNAVIRAVVRTCDSRYGSSVVGFQDGWRGLLENRRVQLANDDRNDRLLAKGGTMLGTARVHPDKLRAGLPQIMQTLDDNGIDVLIPIGGEGTLTAAHWLSEENVPVVGVPKTIDNDIEFVDQTFGFETAVQVAAQALEAAHTEATSARNGIGVVKLMGREAGFISAHATLASLDVNYCLIPEVPFDLNGRGGLFEALESRLLARGHALIAIAEGCGLALEQPGAERDDSGNLRFASKELDVGPRLCEALRAHFRAEEFPVVVKYIDPSYMIRSVAANASDNKYCDLLARHAVHAAMAGKTDLVIGRWNGSFTHVPLSLSTSRKKRVHAKSELWLAVTSTTGQPSLRRTFRAPEAGESPREPWASAREPTRRAGRA